MAGEIFINYRRGDDAGSAGRLHDHLAPEFGYEKLFMDVEGGIRAGENYVRALEARVAACDVMLAVIGPRWIDATDEKGRPRLHNPDDFVRVEIVSALEKDKHVIPVLVGGAAIPHREELPEVLFPLAHRNAVRLTHERFQADVQGLVKELRVALDRADIQRRALVESEQRTAEQAAERERERLRAEEAQRAAANPSLPTGLKLEDIRKAEELANWEFIRTRRNAGEVRDHLARFTGGVTEPYARALIEDIAWATLGNNPDVAALSEFLTEFPSGEHSVAAKTGLERLQSKRDAERIATETQRQEADAWAVASRTDTIAAYERFVRDWPASAHSEMARRAITLKAVYSMRSLRIYEYSDLIYWWTIWMAALICLVLTLSFGETVQFGNNTQKVHANPLVGNGFVAVVFCTLIFVQLRARALYPIGLLFTAALVIASAELIGLDLMVGQISEARVHLSANHYLIVFAVAFSVWAYITFIHSRFTYGFVNPGEIGWRSPLTGQVENYRPLNFSVVKRSDDIVVHTLLGLRFLGLGTGDIEIMFNIPGGGRQLHVFRNVWRPDIKIARMEQLLTAR